MNTEPFELSKQVAGEVTYACRVNYALHQTGFRVVGEVVIRNRGDTPLEGVSVEVGIDGYAGPWTGYLDVIEPGSAVKVDGISLNLPAEKWVDNEEAISTHLSVDLTHAERDEGGTSVPIQLDAYNEWDAARFPESLASFVQPNHPDLGDFAAKVQEVLEGWGESTALNGYQAGHPESVYRMTAAIFETMQGAANLNYVSPPASFERTGQKIRLPEEVMSTGMATCLGLSCFAAAALELAGLHPLVVLIRGHAFAGVWLEEVSFKKPRVESYSVLSEHTKVGKILLFEPTVAAVDRQVSFEQSEEIGVRHLEDPGQFDMVIDIKAARKDGIKPIKARRRDAGFSVGDGVTFAAGPISDIPPTPSRRWQMAEVADQYLPEGETARARDRFERWKSRLLDLSLGSPLISHDPEEDTAIPIDDVDLSAFYRRLDNGQETRLASGVVEQDETRPAVESIGPPYRDPVQLLEDTKEQGIAHEEEVLVAECDRTELRDKGKRLEKRAKRSHRKNGVGDLYAAFGFLHWGEEGGKHRAPLLLVPVQLGRESESGSIFVEKAGGGVEVNYSIVARMAEDFEVDLQPLERLVEQQSDFSIEDALNLVRQSVLETEDWFVEDRVVIDRFSFRDALLWKELNESEDEIREHPNIRRILGTESGRKAEQDGRSEPETAAELPEMLPLPADPSQQSAIRCAFEEPAMVIQGPPGTGKSQVIATVMAEALGRGETVLFVTEKEPARDVVCERLGGLGLDEFTLRIGKEGREIVAQLGDAYRVGQGRDSSDRDVAQTVRCSLEKLRGSQEEVVAALCRRRSTGFSVADGVRRLEEIGEGFVVGIEETRAPDQPSEGELETIYDSAADLAEYWSRVSPLDKNPWTWVEEPVTEYEEREAWRGCLRGLRNAVERLIQVAERLPSEAGVTPDTSVQDLVRVAELGSLLREQSQVEKALIRSEIGEWSPAKVEGLACEIREGREQWRSLSTRYSTEVFEAEHRRLANRAEGAANLAFPLRWICVLWLLFSLRDVRGGGAVEPEVLSRELDSVGDIASQREAMDELRSLIVTGSDIFDATDELGLDAVVEALDWFAEFQRNVQPWSGTDVASHWWHEAADRAGAEARKSSGAQLHSALREYKEARAQVVNQVGSKIESVLGPELDEEIPQKVRDQVVEWLDRFGDLRDWSRYLAVRGVLEDNGLAGLPAALESGELSVSEVQACAERSVLNWWVSSVSERDEMLGGFDDHVHCRNERKLDDLITKGRRVRRTEIREQCLAQIPKRGNDELAEQVRALLHEVESDGAPIPPRILLERTAQLVRRLTPAVVADPQSVARHLPRALDFDVVVFDEASQMRPWKALVPIARGERLVVVGDSEQLPPTHFFGRKPDQDVIRDQLRDLESILDEAVAAGLPTQGLRYHYRSRAEQLVQFSNRWFYGGDLKAFPSPEAGTGRLGAESQPVIAEFVDGTYERGESRTNRREAEAVAQAVMEHLRDKGNSKSIGVVTVNRPQMELVEELLERATREEPALARYFRDDVNEPVMVRNIEGVQGAERDVILFSLVYGPNGDGDLTMNFGALNGEGGARRLNVAITRARERLRVFSSLRPEQIGLEGSASRGLEVLKRFLEFARGECSVGDEDASESLQPDPIVNSITDWLRQRGWEAELLSPDRGGLTITVADPEQPEHDRVGVVVWPPKDPVATSDVARQSRHERRVLEKLGWDLVRIPVLEWFRNSNRQIERIEARLEKKTGDKKPKPSEFFGEDEEKLGNSSGGSSARTFI